MSFANGSVANLSYFSNGNKDLPKESIEVFSDGTVIAIDDFKTATVYGSKVSKVKGKKQDKGHRAEVAAFVDAIAKGGVTPIPFEESWEVSLATLAILESIRTGNTIRLEEFRQTVLEGSSQEA
jgi:predicted dehydrogenase